PDVRRHRGPGAARGHPGVRIEHGEQHVARRAMLLRRPARSAPGAGHVALMVDVDVPWFPRDVQFNEQTFWVQIDVD
ncbi:hypothetical protein C1T28_21840, partial [Bacillus subtilis]